MIKALGLCHALPGQEDELGRRLKTLVAATSREPGCKQYDLCRSLSDPALWILLETWDSEDDLEAHVNTPHFQTFAANKSEVLLGSPDSYRFSLVLPSHPELPGRT
jgi:quinol monooxygenase YgiN